MDEVWKKMYDAARAAQGDRERIVTLRDLTPEWWL